MKNPNLTKMIEATLRCLRLHETALEELLGELRRIELSLGVPNEHRDMLLLRGRQDVAIAELQLVRARIAAARTVL